MEAGTCGVCRMASRRLFVGHEPVVLASRTSLRDQPPPPSARLEKAPREQVYEFVDQYKKLRQEMLAACIASWLLELSGGYGSSVEIVQRAEKNHGLMERVHRFRQRVMDFNMKKMRAALARGSGADWGYQELLDFVCQGTDALSSALTSASYFIESGGKIVYRRAAVKQQEISDLFDEQINAWGQ
jgi:hypothetical protein